MTTTATAKPKAKFSSRNLSAVFKAPLRTKPLPDNATGPLQRPNSRMVVLGRAAVAAPAPLNTPSLKRESQVHDMHVSLVPAGSNWAEQAEKPKENEAAEPETVPAEVALSTAPPEKAWTPESVAEHLHTGSAPTRLKGTVEGCGRWGDDAVEQDIVQNDIWRQRQKEREFPDLKEAVEETKMHHNQGHASATADRSPSMGPQQSEQHHGRATGRWTYFSEQDEMSRPMHEDRWSRDRYGRGDEHRWSRDRFGRDEDDRWSRDRYSHYDDGYGRERRPCYESSRGESAISPAPNDSRTHFSRSDARFDMVASGDRDRALSHSPHRMDWGSSRLERRDGRSSSPAARFRTPPPNRSLTQSAAPASPSPAPATADTAPARAMNWRNASSPDHGPDRAWETRRAANAWSKDDEPHTPVAEEAGSSTESSSHSSASTNPSPAQQVQLLKRPKMLFDPKTGGMVSAKDSPAAAATKRQTTGRSGKEGRDREAPNASKASESVALRPESGASAGGVDTKDLPAKNGEDISPPASACPDDGSTSVEVVAEGASAGQAVKDECGEATMKNSRKVVTRRSSRGTKRAGKVANRSQRGVSAWSERRSGKAAQSRAKASEREVSTQKMCPEEVAVLKDIAEGSSGGVVVISDEQDGIEVSTEVGGFETVKSRRVVLSEKKQHRQRLASTEEAAAPTARASEFAEGKKSARASPADAQSKGEEVHENIGMVAKREVDASKPRGNNARKHGGNSAEQAAKKDRKPRPASKHQPKQSANGQKSKQTAKAASPERNSVPFVEPAAKPTEQVPGEAPAESPTSKKRSQYVKKVAQPEKERGQQRPKREKQGTKSNERKAPSNATATRKPEPATRRQSQRAATPEKAPAAKARPKQVRQVYVVKTPAPAPASATSTAA